MMARILAGVLFIVAWSTSALADVRAYVDRTVIADNETVELTIESNDSFDDPELDALQVNFDVVSTGRSSRVQIVRGKVESKQELVLTLAPRQTGDLRIPALKIGRETTAPIQLKVVAAANEPQSARADLLVEISAEPRSVVVQQQTILTLRLLHAVELRDGKLSIANIPGAVIERLGDDETSDTVRNGRRYSVVTRRLALFPQASGTLRVPAVEFNGQAVTRSGTSPGSFFGRPFGADPFDALFAQTKPVRARSNEITINVAPKPSDAHSPWWLPATALTVSEAWSPDSGPYHVGEPVTRTITLQADGLTPAQLPELPLDAPDGVKHYPDQPSNDMKADAGGVSATRVQKVAYVATRAGTVTLPRIDVEWWNTATRHLEHASLPARTIVFAPAPGGSAAAPAIAVPAPRATTPADNVSPTVAASNDGVAVAAGDGRWQVIAAVVFAVWVATLLVWWWHTARRRGTQTANGVPVPEPLKKSAILGAVKTACKNEDVAQLRDALLQFGQLRWPDAAPKSLGELSARVHDDAVRNALGSIERRMYKTTEGEAALQELAGTLEKWIATDRAPRADNNTEDGLKPLYPERK